MTPAAKTTAAIKAHLIFMLLSRYTPPRCKS
jgi:hypothetical protein